MNETHNFTRAIKTLEFDKITALLAQCALTDEAAATALTLTPTSDVNRIMKCLRQTTDAKELQRLKGSPSFSGASDISDSVERADKGAALSPRELLHISSMLGVTRGLVDYYNRDRRGTPDSLSGVFSALRENRMLEDRINHAIIADDLISDDASPALSDIRQKMRLANNRIKDTLQRFTSGETNSKYLQENIVTMRNGRYVVPVKSEYKNQVKGLVHDISSSGATVFIEPMAVVDANNELAELQSRERHEIERILYELSAACSDYSDGLFSDCRAVNEIAFIFAKAELSYRMDAAEPTINNERRIDLIRARHPLIDRATAVPVSISLGGAWDTLVVTGPNTGGKTVTLKTIGLFTLMAQAGLHIPCDPSSTVGIFGRVLADIGDEQSIEQSLSTFSAHMTNTVRIIDEADQESLVLFDELGAGTDPTEGAALAIAILDSIRERKSICAATTHYAELKAYALQTPGVMNACCEFDVETLRPTYKLIIGTPGKSNAFAISSKLGLPRQIIENAENRIGFRERSFEDVIAKLEAARIEAEKNRAEATEQLRRASKLREETERDLNSKTAKLEAELKDAKNKATKIIEDARITADYVASELEKLKREKDSADFGEKLNIARADMRRKLKESAGKLDPVLEPDGSESYVLPRPLRSGDHVTIISLNMPGVLVGNPDADGNVTVRSGMINTRTNTVNLMLDEDAITVTGADNKKQRAASWKTSSTIDFSPELDLRGETGDDGCFMLDKYIDHALMASVYTLRVIHGKGTGALRVAVRTFLKQDPRVESYRPGTYGEGDDGVSVITLKHKGQKKQ